MRTRRLLIGLTLAAATAACDRSDPKLAAPPAAAAAQPATRPNTFAPGDTVEVRVPGLDPTTGVSDTVARLQADGAVALPYLVDPVPIAGLDPAAAARRVAAAYRDGQILLNPAVSVRRIDYPNPTPPTAPALAARPSTRPAVVDAGDLIEIRVRGLSPDGTTPIVARVQPDGTVGLPLVADVTVGGLDRPAAARAVAAAYRGANVLSQPGVDLRRLRVAGTGGPAGGPIAIGDLVRCSIVGLREKPDAAEVIVVRVDPAGRLDVPLVAPVAGLTDGGAAAAVARAYHDANVLSAAAVSVLTLEPAPADAAHLSLPDGPLQPVPEPLRFLYESR